MGTVPILCSVRDPSGRNRASGPLPSPMKEGTFTSVVRQSSPFCSTRIALREPERRARGARLRLVQLVRPSQVTRRREVRRAAVQRRRQSHRRSPIPPCRRLPCINTFTRVPLPPPTPSGRVHPQWHNECACAERTLCCSNSLASLLTKGPCHAQSTSTAPEHRYLSRLPRSDPRAWSRGECWRPSIRGYKKVNDRAITAGQPTEEQLKAAAADGFKTVINLATIDPRYSLKEREVCPNRSG